MLWLCINFPRFSSEVFGGEPAESVALGRLAAWAGRFTPVVSLPPFGQGPPSSRKESLPPELLLEVEGSFRMFGGRDRLMERIEDGLTDLGHTFATALAPTPLAAALLARARPGTRLARRDDLERALAPIPAAALDLTPEMLETLQGIGVFSLGDCLKLPRPGLLRRVGPELLRSLDRALGRIPDPRAPFVPPPRFEGRLALPAAVVSVEPLLFAARRLLLELEGYLEARGGGAVAQRWTLHHHEGRSTCVDVGLAAPARDPARLLGLLRERLGRMRLTEPVEAVELAVEEILPLVSSNLDLWKTGAEHAEGAWPELLDRLRARLGAAAVKGLRLAADHRPERAFVRTEPALKEQPEGLPSIDPRPLWLLSKPAPLKRKDLALVAGPERIETGWWDGEDVRRDYFVAEDASGLRLWVFQEREGKRQWFVHGIF